MKLYLSSQRLGNFSDKLVELVGDNKNVVVVANAIDDKSISHRNNRVEREFNMLKGIGLNPSELDLRKFFDKGKELKEFVEDKSLVWIRGGNVFILRRAMKASGFDEYVLPLIRDGTIAFGGYSAGTIVACKDLWGSEMVDDLYSYPEDYPVDFVTTSALKLVDFYIVPHIDSKEDYGEDVRNYANYLKKKNKKILTLNDGEVYYSNNDTPRVLK